MPVRVDGPGVGDLLVGAPASAAMRVSEPELATATWEFEVEAEDREEATRTAVAALRTEVGGEAFDTLWEDLDDWNATPRKLQAPRTDAEEAKGGG